MNFGEHINRPPGEEPQLFRQEEFLTKRPVSGKGDQQIDVAVRMFLAPGEAAEECAWLAAKQRAVLGRSASVRDVTRREPVETP